MPRKTTAFITLAIVGIGALAGLRLWQGAPPAGRAAGLVPETAALYVNLYVDPSNGQKRALSDLLGGADEAGTALAGDLVDLFRPLLERYDVDFARDVEPWMGREVAAFYQEARYPSRGPARAVLIEAGDADAAAAFVAGLRGADDARALLDGFIVLGNPGGVRAARAALLGSSLAVSTRFRDALAPLPEDRLVTVYRRGNLEATPLGAAIYASGDGFVLEGTFGLRDLVGLPQVVEDALGPLVDLGPATASSTFAGIGRSQVKVAQVFRDGRTLQQVVISFR